MDEPAHQARGSSHIYHHPTDFPFLGTQFVAEKRRGGRSWRPCAPHHGGNLSRASLLDAPLPAPVYLKYRLTNRVIGTNNLSNEIFSFWLHWVPDQLAMLRRVRFSPSGEGERSSMAAASHYRNIVCRIEAIVLRVDFIGIHRKSGIALFQDPVTGSSFATKPGEPVKAGLRRVRDRFAASPAGS